MTRRFDAAYYEDLRRRVRGVLTGVEAHFPPGQLSYVDELIEVNEPGLALEIMSEMLAEAGVTPHPQVMGDIVRLVTDMGLAPVVAERLRRR